MAEPVKIKTKSVLSGWPMIIGWLAMLIFAFHASTHMVAAGDTWVAMACGRHFINHGVDTVEPFSANSHHAGPTEADVKTWPGWAQTITEKVGIDTVRYWHPTGWLNQNWLTHVIFYWLTHESPLADAGEFSYNGLVYWKIAIYIITIACVYYTGRILGVNPALSAVFACFALFVGRSFLDIRPAGFSNMLVAIYLLILALTTYRNILYIWLLVPVTVFWCNVHGGYIYAFIMLVPFVALNFLSSFAKKNFVSIGLKGVIHTIAAGFVALIAMIIFNPFHLTNLTHTFIISLSKDAEMWRTVNEWHPAFEWNNPVGDEKPFLIMYIIAWFAFAIWIGARLVTHVSIEKQAKRRIQQPQEYAGPRFDPALMVIAALTIYMAIRSRRFIPIAAIAACPVIAMLIDQLIRAISAARNLYKNNRLIVAPMTRDVQSLCIIAGAGAVLCFSTAWGLKFKRVYLDPWYTDTKLNSVFMRMTASDVKPFYAMKFIKDNKLKGKMFNYWTEGGFIAYGQEPDPNTGRTPLQLFMDGRAQAAYEPRVYRLWADIMGGGPVVQKSRVRKHKLTSKDYVKIGKWVDKRLTEHDVWLVLMPSVQFNSPLVMGLEHNRDWLTVFMNRKQKIFVNVKTEQGKKLFEGIFNGQTVYSDEFAKNLIFAHYMLLSKNKAVRQRGFNHALKAFELNQSATPARIIVSASKYPEFRQQVYEFCKQYFDDFMKNKDVYAKKDGQHNRIVAALWTINHLKQIARQQNNDGLIQLYDSVRKQLTEDANKLAESKRW